MFDRHRGWLRDGLAAQGYDELYVLCVGRWTRADRLRSAVTGTTAKAREEKARQKGACDAYEEIAMLRLRAYKDLEAAEARSVFRRHTGEWAAATAEDEAERDETA